MTHCNTPKDIIAEHVRQLLDLDEGGRRAQLASLSTYAANKNVPQGYSVNGGTSRPNSKWSGSPSSASASTYSGSNGGSGQELSSDSPESSGSEGLAKGNATDGAFLQGLSLGTQSEVNPSQQLQEMQHSTDLLKAALANWEACLQTGEVCASTPPSNRDQQTLAAEQTKPAKISLQSLKSARPSPTSAFAGASSTGHLNSEVFAIASLQRALSELSCRFSPDVAQQSMMHREVRCQQQEMARKDHEEDDLKALRRLRQHLEQQQEQSMSKIMRLMQSEQHRLEEKRAGLDAWASCFTPGATQADVGMWPSILNPVQQPQLAAAQCLVLDRQPMLSPMSSGSMPSAYGMPAMAMKTEMPWAQGPVNTHCERPLTSQAAHTWRQGQHQRNGDGAQDATPNATGNAPLKNRPVVPAGAENETLLTNLRQLQKVDPEQVVVVRKICRLGFESPATLTAHYSKYGKVKKVLVAHSHVKSQNLRSAPFRLRPSGLGFVVMSKKEEADAILAEGPEQVVESGPDLAGVAIRVQHFERRVEDAKDADLEDDGDEKNEEDGKVAASFT